VGQYLVAVALASSFVQASLSGAVILGLVVLLSQVTRQVYKPDLRALGAAERALYLKQVIRSTEDELYGMDPQPPKDSLARLRSQMSAALAEIEKQELEN